MDKTPADFPGKKRIELATDAAAQLNELADAVLRQIPGGGEALLRLVAARAYELSGAIMDALDDDLAEFEEIRACVNHGRRLTADPEDDDPEGGANV